jgi:hypothetical protein
MWYMPNTWNPNTQPANLNGCIFRSMWYTPNMQNHNTNHKRENKFSINRIQAPLTFDGLIVSANTVWGKGMCITENPSTAPMHQELNTKDTSLVRTCSAGERDKKVNQLEIEVNWSEHGIREPTRDWCGGAR